ncbi:hypothetical protein [Cellulomonas sp. ATA003]|uniref:hypothetical protein n=1 Tax=Cellulomonas sp. ATA003 TaxID=3073064 RepID=UPI0028731D68|nr:hypothetical protein [Cellulomonas sp. ATA003]WNB84527.1 hypothetical protein REH70_11870 [Cellulomonas sp. ATA003]
MTPADRDPTDLGLAPAPAPAEHACHRGWIGGEDHPKPCPTCKPHLTRRRPMPTVTAPTPQPPAARTPCPHTTWTSRPSRKVAGFVIRRCTDCGTTEARRGENA